MFPRAGVLASSLTLSHLQTALLARRVFATRSPTLALLVVGNEALMGSHLCLDASETLTLGVWCHDSAASHERGRLELWTTGGKLIEMHETRGLQQVTWRITAKPQDAREHWFVVRVLYNGMVQAYSSPIWVCWSRSQ
jgi:hypothetical protein